MTWFVDFVLHLDSHLIDLVSRYGTGGRGGVDAVTGATMTGCLAPAGSDMARVDVSITTQPLVGGILGGFTETARETATAQCGITQGAIC